jgi:hypothetical protein
MATIRRLRAPSAASPNISLRGIRGWRRGGRRRRGVWRVGGEGARAGRAEGDKPAGEPPWACCGDAPPGALSNAHVAPRRTAAGQSFCPSAAPACGGRRAPAPAWTVGSGAGTAAQAVGTWEPAREGGANARLHEARGRLAGMRGPRGGQGGQAGTQPGQGPRGGARGRTAGPRRAHARGPGRGRRRPRAPRAREPRRPPSARSAAPPRANTPSTHLPSSAHAATSCIFSTITGSPSCQRRFTSECTLPLSLGLSQ